MTFFSYDIIIRLFILSYVILMGIFLLYINDPCSKYLAYVFIWYLFSNDTIWMLETAQKRNITYSALRAMKKRRMDLINRHLYSEHQGWKKEYPRCIISSFSSKICLHGFIIKKRRVKKNHMYL